MYYKNVCVRAAENAVHNKYALVDQNQICICSRCPNSIQTHIYNKMIVFLYPISILWCLSPSLMLNSPIFCMVKMITVSMHPIVAPLYLSILGWVLESVYWLIIYIILYIYIYIRFYIYIYIIFILHVLYIYIFYVCIIYILYIYIFYIFYIYYTLYTLCILYVKYH